MDVATAAGSSSWFSDAIPVAGVLLGGALGSFATWKIQDRQLKHQERQANIAVRRNACVEMFSSTVQFADAVRDLARGKALFLSKNLDEAGFRASIGGGEELQSDWIGIAGFGLRRSLPLLPRAVARGLHRRFAHHVPVRLEGLGSHRLPFTVGYASTQTARGDVAPSKWSISN